MTFNTNYLASSKEYHYVDVMKNIVMGIKHDYDFKVGEIKMKEQERLFLYTDGVTEAQTTDRKFLGPENLLKILNQKELSLSGTLEHIYRSIQKFIKGAPQFDDITMLIVEFRHKK